MALTLKDESGGIVAVLTDETLDMRSLEVGPKGAAPVREHSSRFTVGQSAPVTRPGTCQVFLSVGRRDGTPVIALPHAGDDGQRRYHLGTIELVAP
jgi:hypothetical protein